MGKYFSTKVIELGSTAFRQPMADSHCKFIHGYQLKAKIWFSCTELDSNNWVFDFGGLKELKTKLSDHFDHKCIISKNDPAKHVFKELERYSAIDLVVMDGVGIEKFAEFVFNEANVFVSFKTSGRVSVERVELFEHENNSAIYEKESISFVSMTQHKEPVKVSILDFVEKKDTAGQSASKPAQFGNTITSGWSNPFGGTNWG